MKELIVIGLSLLTLLLFQCIGAVELSDKYLISYGTPEAPIKIVEYFSFVCPHCLELFKRDFGKIRETFLETQEVYWEFHPVPLDLVTVQALACLADLNPREKRIFLEVILDEAEADDPQLTSLMLIKAMEIFQKPKPRLIEEAYLEETTAFVDAFNYIKEGGPSIPDAVPSVVVNGTRYPRDIPDFKFVTSIVAEEKKIHAQR